MLTRQEERDLIDKISFKYLDKYAERGDIVTVFDLFYDVLEDDKFVEMANAGLIDVSGDDLMTMCKEEYEFFFSKELILM